MVNVRLSVSVLWTWTLLRSCPIALLRKVCFIWSRQWCHTEVYNVTRQQKFHAALVILKTWRLLQHFSSSPSIKVLRPSRDRSMSRKNCFFLQDQSQFLHKYGSIKSAISWWINEQRHLSKQQTVFESSSQQAGFDGLRLVMTTPRVCPLGLKDESGRALALMVVVRTQSQHKLEEVWGL